MSSVDLSPQPVRANRFLPHLASELSRLGRRRLFRALALLLLGGVVLVSGGVFALSHKTQDVPAGAQARYERELERFERNFPAMVQGWQQCAATTPEGERVEDYCGPAPDRVRDAPRLEWFYDDKRYEGASTLPAVVGTVIVAAALLAFVLGASSGGAEWSSRSMTLQLLWEPRRFRLLCVKWIALVVVSALTALVTLAVALALAVLTVALRGTPDKADGRYDPGFWGDLAGIAGRGLVVVAMAATFGYALSMLVRNTGAALGVAFVYFAVVENAVRIASIPLKVYPEKFLLTTNGVSFLSKTGLDVPNGDPALSTASGLPLMFHLSHVWSLLTLLVYLAVLCVAAVWSFTRRDVA
jgi:ABC-type transport system involved in multi-copper enzyme maturation permease subunit